MRRRRALAPLLLLSNVAASWTRQLSPPPCTDRTAYVTVMTAHNQTVGPSTYLGGKKGGSVSARHSQQVQLVIVLARSLRSVETCRRDFIVLLGTQSPLSDHHRRLLLNEGLILVPTPPIIPGVPTADKLHAWRLTNYTQCAILDVDQIALRPIDDAFGTFSELTIAHHPYDHLQAQCGIGVAERGIAALMVIRPSLTTYNALMAYLLKRFRADQLLYSDQTGLMCFFANRSETLPCHYVYDVSMTTALWLPRWMKNCRLHRKQHVLRNCLSDVRDRCQGLANRQMCDETSAHIRKHCVWPPAAAATELRAFHFKGSKKPWHIAEKCPLIRKGVASMEARSGSSGRPIVAAADQIRFDEETGRCMAFPDGLPVRWTGREEAIGPRCCNTLTVVAAQWFSFVLHRDGSLGNTNSSKPAIAATNGKQMLRSRQRRQMRAAVRRESVKISRRGDSGMRTVNGYSDETDGYFTEIPSDAVYRPPGGGVI